ncbi:ARS binding protein 2-domain-containing protein [Mycotypha africana]|uniref:ARS binding protein 2-domain-containing protein n=1 Tax=Mycotypha africana TaxID=64632 RepID=UPI00230011C2|nr:ARS binding protein 2-domain-containing protein [Mycotypha africana]KAI8973355.1 ARS binding protein 2-domain-containing protein [Mycotypha africana]
MNLSDLVHRSAGDNSNKNNLKDSLTGNSNNNSNTFNSRFIPLSSSSSNSRENDKSSNNHNNNLFQQLGVDSTSSPTSHSNAFASLTSQSQQQPFLFSMSNTDWINNDVLFNDNILNNGSSEPSIESISTTNVTNSTASKTTNGFNTVILNSNVALDHCSDKALSSINNILTDAVMSSVRPAQTATSPKPVHTSSNQQQQHPHQQPVYPSPHLDPFKPSTEHQLQNNFFYNFKYQENNHSSSPAQNSNNYTMDNNTFISVNNDGLDIPLSRPFDTNNMETTTPMNTTISTKVATPDSSISESTAPVTDGTMKSIFSPASSSSTHQQPQTSMQQIQQQLSPPIQPQPLDTSSIATSKTINRSAMPPITNTAPLSEVNHTTPPSKKPRITGANVTAENIVDGYIQFVLSHDAAYINDGIESLVFAKRKFQSVPKTGDITYTTWDIFQLVKKLHHQEIKNWSQLVGQLGLQDMAGRPQFAQRVKRWMHKYKIDCYFDYLLGNEYEFNPPDDKYSHCLLIGNYKRKGTATTAASHTAAAAAVNIPEQTSLLDDDDMTDDTMNAAATTANNGKQARLPILMAGSRKRMRENNQNIYENSQKFAKTHHEEEEEDRESVEEDLQHDEAKDNDQHPGIGKEHDDLDQTQQQQQQQEEEDDDDDEMEFAGQDEQDDIKQNDDEEDNETDDEEEEEEEELVDEIDELASSSSSPTSPILTALLSPKIAPSKEPIDAKVTNTSKVFAISSLIKSPSATIPCPIDRQTQTEQSLISLLPSIPPLSSCSNCKNAEKEVNRLKAYVLQLETQVERQDKQINKLLRLRDRTEKWRKQIISDLARGPTLTSASDNENSIDSYDEEDDEEEYEAGHTTGTTNSEELHRL